jgi:DNA polymerase III delta prime subunit
LESAISVHREEKVVHVALLFGDDFTFTDAERSFGWLDTLIESLNTGSQGAFNKTVKAFYSNMTSYFDAKVAHKATYKQFRGDFMPYA